MAYQRVHHVLGRDAPGDDHQRAVPAVLTVAGVPVDPGVGEGVLQHPIARLDDRQPVWIRTGRVAESDDVGQEDCAVLPDRCCGCALGVVTGGFAREGLPVGIQIIGRPFEEPTVLRTGRAFEAVTDWWRREPLL